LPPSVGTPSSRPVASMAPDARRRFYEQSVKTLEDATASTSMHRSAFGLMTITILVGALLALFAILGVLKGGAALQ